MRQTIVQTHSSCSMQKTAPKNSEYSKNESILKMAKNGNIAKPIAHAKYSVWVNNQNCLKRPKNASTNTFKLFYAKSGSKKLLIFEKWEHFESGQKWPQCKGYSPCKILTLGQKIKLPKTCEKRFYKHFEVVLCKKPLQKTANIRKMRAFWKWPKMATMQRL